MNDEIAVTEGELYARAMVTAADLYAAILVRLPDGGAWVREHVEAGAGVELLVQLRPSMALGFRLVDSDGTYVAISAHKIEMPRTH